MVSPPQLTNVSTVPNYSTFAQFQENVNVSELGFSDVWDLTGGIAIFNSQKEIIENQLTAFSEVELTAGKQFVFPEVYGCGFNLSTSVDASVATINGKVLQLLDSVSKKLCVSPERLSFLNGGITYVFYGLILTY